MNSTESTSRPPRRDWLSFDRYDRIGLSALVGLVALGASAFWLALPLAAWRTGDPLPVPFFSEVEVPELAGTGLGHGPANYDLIIDDPTSMQRLLGLLPGLAYLALVLLACYLVLRITGDIGHGDPFQPHNVRRLRIMAVIAYLGWPIVTLAESFCRMAILTGSDLGTLSPRVQMTLPVLPVLFGLTLALIAEAFKSGSQLRDDTDGLV